MSGTYSSGSRHLKSDLIDALVSKAKARFSANRRDTVETFLRQLYANVPPDDLATKEPECLYGAAVSLLGFIDQHAPGQSKVRVYNPKFEEHGWKAGHTIVEMINDDSPFLVDSITAALGRMDLIVHLVIHPVIWSDRDPKHRLRALRHENQAEAKDRRESVIYVEINEQTDPSALTAIEYRLLEILRDVRAAVEDWPVMQAKAKEMTQEMEAPHPALTPHDSADTRDFLSWMAEDHFTFLGYREYVFSSSGKKTRCEIKAGSGLGVLRRDEASVFDGLRAFDTLPADIQTFLRTPTPLLITKGSHRSTVHRPVHHDVVILRDIGPDGAVRALRLFAGLFTADVYFNSPAFIPILARKMEKVVAEAGFDPLRHSGKRLAAILETLPRDELFQSSTEELIATALGILNLQERQRVALFIRKDPLKRFASCLVFIPRDRYDTDLRRKVQAILERDLGGRCAAFYTQVADSPLARVHFIIKFTQEGDVHYRSEEIEHQIAEVSRSWSDHLHDALLKAHGEAKGLRLYRRWGEAFPSSYRETHEVDT